MTVMTRTFTPEEIAAREAWIDERVENECEGCESIVSEIDGYSAWHPAEDCPVHGLECDGWYAELNAELDKRWPGRKVPTVDGPRFET